MKRKLFALSWLAILVTVAVIAVSVAVAQPGPDGPPSGDMPEPPQEAIAACQDLQEGKVCQINAPQGPVEGTCQVLENRLICVPAGGPPEGPNGGPPGGTR